jgi:hypothetical protein
MRLDTAPLDAIALDAPALPPRVGVVRAITLRAGRVAPSCRPRRVRVAATAAHLRVTPRPRLARVHPRPARVRPFAPEA